MERIISNYSSSYKKIKSEKASLAIQRLRQLLAEEQSHHFAKFRETKFGWETQDRTIVYLMEVNMTNIFSCDIRISWDMQNHFFKISISSNNKILTSDSQSCVCSKADDAAKIMFEIFLKSYKIIILSAYSHFQQEAKAMGYRNPRELAVS